MEDTQLMKGILEGCVLSIISRGETYGYEILAKLNADGFNDLIEGTLYPVLARLERKKLISCRMGKSPLGPPRKYFSITEEGEIKLTEFIRDYVRITGAANTLLFSREDGKA